METTNMNETIEPLIKELLLALGEDPNREGLQKTPKRVAQAYLDLTNGYQKDLDKIVNEAIFNESFDEMVLIKDIEFCSLCEHHLLPFFGKVHIAYMPNNKVIGLSKLPRIIEVFARRLQLQERITRQVAETIEHYLQPKGVAVLIEATHMCMMMRGVQKQFSTTVTTNMTGVFSENNDLRQQFLRLSGLS